MGAVAALLEQVEETAGGIEVLAGDCGEGVPVVPRAGGLLDLVEVLSCR